MGCLEKSVIVRYLAGDLPYHDHQRAEVHLDGCVSCMGLLTELTVQPEQRAEIAAAGGGRFHSVVTERLPIDTDHGAKVMWLERHYKLQIGDVIEGKYRIEKVLGEGGMGIVLLATHLGLREKVALKFMHPTMVQNADHSARFIREARAAVKLRDENVARVLDLGEIEETGPFIVMEYLAGQDLLKYLKTNAPLPIGESVELIRQAAAGVAAAHNAGIIHRDLKPGNMFLTEKPNGGRVLKVLDFGVSKYIEGDSLSMTGTNMVVGSPMYMAPEMFESARNASFGSDVWAIGVIFYRMLTGRLPFYAESLPEMVAKIHFGKPTPLQHWRPELSPELVQIVDVCLARQPGDRFSSASEFLNALAQLPGIRADPRAPTVAVSHLPRDREDSTGSSARLPTLDHSGPLNTVMSRTAPPAERKSPWVFALVGAAASAALFAVIMVATGGSKSESPTQSIEPAATKVAPESPTATTESKAAVDAKAKAAEAEKQRQADAAKKKAEAEAVAKKKKEAEAEAEAAEAKRKADEDAKAKAAAAKKEKEAKAAAKKAKAAAAKKAAAEERARRRAKRRAKAKKAGEEAKTGDTSEKDDEKEPSRPKDDLLLP